MLGGPIAPDGADSVGAAIADGSFALPEAGTDSRGVRWRSVTPDAEASIGELPYAVYYAAAKIVVPQGRHAFARTGPSGAVWCNGILQPGDVYGSRRKLVPLRAVAGENLVVVELEGGRGPARLELWTTPGVLVVNTDDLTAPDPRTGDTTEQYLGAAVVNLGDVLQEVTARVAETDQLAETVVRHAWVPGHAVTQLGWIFRPKVPMPEPDAVVQVRLRLESTALGEPYEREILLTAIDPTKPYERTRLSTVDGSVQYYGVNPPTDYDPAKKYGLVLTLHGAGVEPPVGQAGAYASKDWAFVVAPTNRRGFGFDWEEWGRMDGRDALDHAMATFPIDPTRVYLTGHSMGGHGTWQFGVLFATRFATVTPSAGWSSFYTYTGDPIPTGAVGRARASSNTNEYTGNLANRGVFIIHGTADNVVPPREASAMYDRVSKVTSDIRIHWEQNAGHWWDYPDTPGQDCVDFGPAFEFMKAHTLDPTPLDFRFKSPSPWVTEKYSFATLRSEETPYQDLEIVSSHSGGTVSLETTNVRSLELDGSALSARGVRSIQWKGEAHAVAPGPMALGPQEGKNPRLHGPFNQVFHRPFCFAYADGDEAVERWVSYMVSIWSLIGNGTACAVPFSRVDGALRSERNMVYVGVPSASLTGRTLPFRWDADSIAVGSTTHVDSALLFVFPEGDRLSAVVTATAGAKSLLYRVMPFSSRSGMPDYAVWTRGGLKTAGFFTPTWQYDPGLAQP